tara:strand:- start:357 stop:1361 length:1005 start_codon:yes stop_codon:yes gene_type:complete
MAFILNDRVKETSITTGTGTLNLAGAVQDFETFVAGIGTTNETYYCIVHPGTGEFEVGRGTVTDATPDTLSRAQVFSSSNSDNPVDFSAGTKDVFCTLPASKAVVEDENNDVTLPADLTVGANIDVSSGTIKLDGNYPTGTNNVALGNTALDSIGNGGAGHNVAIGHAALTADDTGTGNVGIGAFALTATVTGNYNTAIGQEALKANTSTENNAIGYQSMLTSYSGEKNVALGFWTLKNLGNNDKNVAIGHKAGLDLTGGDNNIIVGHNAQAASATTSNQITLGDANINSLRIPGLQSGASSGDVLTFDGTDIGLATPTTGATEAFAIKMALAL